MNNTITRLINNRYELKIETSKDIKTNINSFVDTIIDNLSMRNVASGGIFCI